MKERYQSKIAVFLMLKREKNGEEEILLQRRYNTGYMDGKYDLACSGHLEKGESISMAVVREAKEEIGLDIDEKDLKLISVIHPYQEDYLNIFFKAERYDGIPKIMEPDKCDDLQWYSINKLPKEIIPRIEKMIINMQSGVMYDDGDFTYQKNDLSK